LASETGSRGKSGDYEEPGSELEKKLADLWNEIMKVDRVGIHDNFFELGMTSIQATIFLNNLQEWIGEIVYIVWLFKAPTIAELARYLGKHYSNAISKLVPNECVSRTRTIFPTDKIDGSKVAQMRELLRPVRVAKTSKLSSGRNPQMIFVLCPPRSG